MARRTFPLSALLALSLAGCVQPIEGLRPPLPGTSAAAPGPDGDGIVVGGNVSSYAGGFLANLTAHNAGGRTWGYRQAYCIGSPWVASLSGPPGDGLDYLGPRDRLGCPGKSGAFPPGAWLNWTANPGCILEAVCDNQWDGRLWDRGTPFQAPNGTYTWTFRFSYDAAPPPPDGPFNPVRAGAKELAFRITLP
ncbi:MAG TPA: hypothetical protein VHI93_03110 [Candidatus Thermoplasmatota archaeon]|nr:hypothetical protein [Candidatus Thermoplasmatota archaeon]